MCLGVPAKVCEMSGLKALVDFGGVKREVLIGVSGLKKEDLVMVHAGMIIGKIEPEAVVNNLEAYREIMIAELTGRGVDPEEADRKTRKEFEEILRKLGIQTPSKEKKF